MNAPFVDVLFSSRWRRAAAALAFVLYLAQGLPAQAPAAPSAPASAPPAGIGATAPTVGAPQTTAPAQTATPAQTTTAPQTGAADTTGTQGGFRPSPVYTQDSLTEFQQLVASSTGRGLPIFGASIFAGVPSTFAPVNDVPVGPEYTLGPGDTIAVQLAGQINQQYNFTVDRTGTISVPLLGPVQVAGVPYRQLNSYLHDQFGRVYRNFTLNATLGALRSIQVFVVGEARSPGTYSISSLSTLLNAVFASGGPLPDGSLRDIQVKRDGKTLVHFDLYDLLLRGDKSNDIRLLSGDVIFIPFVGPQVAVAGSVNTPAIYELKGPTTVAQAMQLAGGTTAVATSGAVRLERVFEHSERSVEDINLATGGSQPVRNGDIISVSSIVERFRNAVTLRGNVANPGRYQWHPGMRLSDLIPNKQALIPRSYWDRQNQLGQLSQDYLPNSVTPVQNQGALQVRGGGTETQAQPQTRSTSQGTGQSQNGNQNQTQNQGQSTDQTAQTNQTQGATGTQPQGSNGSTLAQRASAGSGAGGSSVGAALTASNSPFSPQNDVVLTAPDIDWSYAVIQRLSAQDLKTSLLPFDLGRLVLQGDASQNYELQPNDIVTVFSTADIRVPTTQQTRYVRLEGEFVAPGVYSVQPGETLRSLLRRAGAFTPEAYLYASEFTRESTRRVESQRLQEYADELDAQISSVTATNTARALSGTDQAAAAVSAQDAHDAVARLRRTVPTGRIVLDLRPTSLGVDALPDLALEDGDRFVVPRVPSSITVQGQVYNGNAFVYTPNRHMLDYLRRAGGPDREADKRREFILRADGSVISNQYADVRRAPVYPGDTLVVPPTIDRRGVFQKIVDLTSIFTGIGYSAATLYLLAHY